MITYLGINLVLVVYLMVLLRQRGMRAQALQQHVSCCGDRIVLALQAGYFKGECRTCRTFYSVRP